MNKHYKPLLAMLKTRGKSGAFNNELNQIAHRFSARFEELRKGKFDGIRYNITCTYISPGVYKYVLHENELPADDVIEILNTAPVDPKVSKEIADQKWEQTRRLFKKEEVETEAQVYKRKVKEFEEQLMIAESWLEANYDRLLPDAKKRAIRRKNDILSKLTYYQSTLEMYEN